MTNENRKPTSPEIRAWMREQQRRWRAKNPEKVRLQQLRSYKHILERHGFSVSGGDIDLQTGKPIERGGERE